MLSRRGHVVTRINDARGGTLYLRACPDCDLVIEWLTQGTVPRAHPNCRRTA